MEEFGRFLKEERMARGISLSAVQVSTRIRTAYLEAIEAGDFASLPGNTYARGFLKLYAKAIGLDPEEVVRRYDGLQGQQMADVQEFQPPERDRLSERLARRRRKRRIQTLRWAGILVLFVALIVLGREWLFAPDADVPSDGLQVGTLIEDNQSEPGDHVVSTESDMTDNDVSADVTADGSSDREESHLGDPTSDGQTHVDQNRGDADKTAAQHIDDQQVDHQPPDSSQEDSISGDTGDGDGDAVPAWVPADEKNEIRVTLTYEGVSWTGVWVDGERVVYEEVPAGTVLNWTAEEIIRVRLGRGNDVRIELNGEDIGPAGNGVVDREFTMESVMALRRQED